MGCGRRTYLHFELTTAVRAVIFSMLMLLVGPAIAGPTAPVFTVVPSKIQPPEGVALGDFRRLYHPFENWTLICDDNLRTGVRICNIRQEIAVSQAGTIFSWTMADTETGEARMIVSAPAAIGDGGEILFRFHDGVTYSARVMCNPQACTTLVPVGPRIRKHIEQGLNVEISFLAPPVGEVRFSAPMKGLAAALAAVNVR